MTVTSRTLEDTKKVARKLLKELSASKNKKNNARVLALIGELGSGKTTLTRYIAEFLGIHARITSPTFVIEKIYRGTTHHYFKTLIHVDAYRLCDANELASLGWSELLSKKNTLIVLEWADRVADLLPEDAQKVYLEVIDEQSRTISW